MKRPTEQGVKRVCAEYVRACLTELAPVMRIDVLPAPPDLGTTADFIAAINETRLAEAEWSDFFNVMMETASLPESSESSKDYRPSDAEIAWAGKIAIAIRHGKIERVQKLLDRGPGGLSIFDVQFEAVRGAQSIPEYDDDGVEQPPPSIRGEIYVENDTIQITITPFARQSEAERKGYKRLIHATICWFIMRNANVLPSAPAEVIEISSQLKAFVF